MGEPECDLGESTVVIEVAIEMNNRVRVAQVRGKFSDADVWEFVERIQELSDAASCDVLYDCSDVHDSDLTVESVRKLARLQRHDPVKKVAIVAGADVVFGMCRMFQIAE